MKKIIAFSIMLASISPSICEEKPDLQQLEDLLAQEAPDTVIFRAPAVPDSLGDSLGAVQFKGYNGSTFDFGASLNGYYGIVGSGTAAQNVTMPGNIGMGTVPVPSAVNNLTSRLLISALGRIGVGNFVPGTGTNNGLPNAVLNVEGDNSASANSAVHVGSRVVAIDPLISGTAYSTQIDGNCYGVQYSQFNTQLNITRTFNIVQATFIRATDLPLTINTPGLYVLAENITLTTDQEIRVNAGGAGSVIDFNDFTITGTGTSARCIRFNNTSDVTVRNGRISGFGTACIATLGDNNSNITIENMNIDNFVVAIDTGGTAISNDRWLINNCVITNGTVVDPIINWNRVHTSIVEDCVINNCVSAGGSSDLRPFRIRDSSNCIFRNCIVTDCSNTNMGGNVTAFVFYEVGSTNILFENCDVSNNIADMEFRAFRFTFADSTATLINCSVCNNQSASTYGVFLNTNPICTMYNCIFGGNSSTTLTQAYSISATPSLANNCIAYNNTTSAVTTGASIGFNVASATRSALNNCIAFGQSAGAAGSNQAIGINFSIVDGSNEDSLVANCIAFGQETGMRISGTNTINQIVGNISTKNTNNYVGFPAGALETAAGIVSINGSLTIPLVNVSIT